MNEFETHKKKFFSYLDNIKKEDNVAIISHANCTDGMVSVVFMSEILKKRYPAIKIKIYFCKYGIGNLNRIEENLLKDKVTKVFILDLNADLDMIEELKNIQNKYDTLFIDHHPLGSKLNIDNKIIKTHKDDCTSIVLFKFGSGIIDYESLNWLCCIASFSEFSYLNKENLELIQKYYPDFNLENIQNSSLFKLSNKIGSLITYYSDDSMKAYQIIYKKDFETIERIHKEVSNEFEKCLSDFEKNSEKHFNNHLYFYHFKSGFAFGSALGTTLSIKHKGSTIIVFSASDFSDKIKVSARNNGVPLKYSMNDMIKAGISGLQQAIGGGHAPASGGLFLKKDIDKFKENVINFVKDKTKE